MTLTLVNYMKFDGKTLRKEHKLSIALIMFGLLLWIVAAFCNTFPTQERTLWLEVWIAVLIIAGLVFVGHGGLLLVQS